MRQLATLSDTGRNAWQKAYHVYWCQEFKKPCFHNFEMYWVKNKLNFWKTHWANSTTGKRMPFHSTSILLPYSRAIGTKERKFHAVERLFQLLPRMMQNEIFAGVQVNDKLRPPPEVFLHNLRHQIEDQQCSCVRLHECIHWSKLPEIQRNPASSG